MQANRSIRDVVAFTMVSALCVLYFVEWRRSKVAFDKHSISVDRDVADLRKWLEAELVKANSLVRALGREVSLMKDGDPVGKALGGQSEVPALKPVDVVEGAPGPSELGTDESLPPMPTGISNPVSFVRGLDPEKFFGDPSYNPGARELTSMEKVKAGCELAIARAKMEILDKEIQRICAWNIDRMRQEGSYVEYEQGQPPQPADVITFGEITERGSTRIYYFVPEEFGEIYEKKAKQKEVGELLVRRLLRFAQGKESKDAGGQTHE